MPAAPPLDSASPTARRVEGVLANLLLVVLLFPYLSPVPMQTDVQPFGVVVAAGCLLLLLVIRGYVLNFDRTDLVLLGVALLYAAYADWSVQAVDMTYLRKNAIMLLVFPAYWAVKQLYARMASRTVLVVAWVYLGITLLQALAPAIYEPFSAALLPRLVSLGRSGRGLTGPCPEQSFLAYIALGFPIVYKLIAARETDVDPLIHRRRLRILISVSVALILLSRSVTGVVFGTILGGLAWLQSSPSITVATRRLIAGTLALAVSATVGAGIMGARTARLLRLAVSHPSLVLVDASIASRYVQILAGAYTAVTNPLGTGKSVGHPEVFETAAAALGFDGYIPRESMQYIRANRTATGEIAVLSPFADSLARLGWLFIAQLAFLIALLRYPPVRLLSRVFLLLGIVSSFPLSFPFFWLLLGANEGWHAYRRGTPAEGRRYAALVPA